MSKEKTIPIIPEVREDRGETPVELALVLDTCGPGSLLSGR
jgi:hypothetical protein